MELLSRWTDEQAIEVATNLPADHRDAKFCLSLVREFRENKELSNSKRKYLHSVVNSFLSAHPEYTPVEPIPVPEVFSLSLVDGADDSEPLPLLAPVLSSPAMPVIGDIRELLSEGNTVRIRSEVEIEPPSCGKPRPLAALLQPTPVVDEKPIIPVSFEGAETIMLIYDIPQALTEDEEDPFYNPSNELRRFAVRLNKSCWLLRISDIPYPLIAKMNERGVKVRLLPIDSRNTTMMQDWAIDSMKEDLVAQEVRTNRTVARAFEKLNSPDGDPNTKLKAYEKAIKDVGDRVAKLVDSFKCQAERFRLNTSTVQLKETLESVRQIQQTMFARAGLYKQAQSVLATSGGAEGAALSTLMETGGADIGVVADAVEELAGEDATHLREVFTGS